MVPPCCPCRRHRAGGPHPVCAPGQVRLNAALSWRLVSASQQPSCRSQRAAARVWGGGASRTVVPRGTAWPCPAHPSLTQQPCPAGRQPQRACPTAAAPLLGRLACRCDSSHYLVVPCCPLRTVRHARALSLAYTSCSFAARSLALQTLCPQQTRSRVYRQARWKGSRVDRPVCTMPLPLPRWRLLQSARCACEP